MIAGRIAVVMLLVGASAHAATVYDLADDWSDVANPNGPWALRNSPTTLFATNLPDYYGNGSNQNAWADEVAGAPRHVPFWMKRDADGIIEMHGAEIDRTGTDFTSAVWTSPEAGIAQIDGAAWSTWVSHRAMQWQIRLNGGVLTQGDIVADGTYDQGNPFYFADGSGGPGALIQTVAPGDELELAIISLSQSGNLGDSVALGFSITLVPEPTSLVLLALGLLTVGLAARRRCASR